MWSATLFVLLDAHLTSCIKHTVVYLTAMKPQRPQPRCCTYMSMICTSYLAGSRLSAQIRARLDKKRKRGNCFSVGHARCQKKKNRRGSHRWQQRTYGGHATNIDRAGRATSQERGRKQTSRGAVALKGKKKKKGGKQYQCNKQSSSELLAARVYSQKQRWTETNLKLKERFSQKWKFKPSSAQPHADGNHRRSFGRDILD